MDYLLLALAVILMIVGIAGCLLPVLPGPPLSYVGLILFCISHAFVHISKNLFIILAIVAVVVTVIDYIVPIWGTKPVRRLKIRNPGVLPSD
ncbi:MAG: DUF456 family protein [Bacteroidales bacterium]|nr:DUF456 family protein [Bacteroidales bacterium]